MQQQMISEIKRQASNTNIRERLQSRGNIRTPVSQKRTKTDLINVEDCKKDHKNLKDMNQLALPDKNTCYDQNHQN